VENHATSDDSLVKTIPLQWFFAFQVLRGGKQSTESVESCWWDALDGNNDTMVFLLFVASALRHTDGLNVTLLI
jgi:hypothetical protein